MIWLWLKGAWLTMAAAETEPAVWAALSASYYNAYHKGGCVYMPFQMVDILLPVVAKISYAPCDTEEWYIGRQRVAQAWHADNGHRDNVVVIVATLEYLIV